MALFARMMVAPRASVSKDEIAAIADADARHNWLAMITFRDRLLAQPTLEAAYLDLVRNGIHSTPPLFVDQLVHLLMRNVLDSIDDPFVLRAGELFFRPQRLSRREGLLLLADDEIVQGQDTARRDVSLLAMFAEAHVRDLDLLTRETAEGYHGRSDAFDLVLDFRRGLGGREGLATAMTRWIAHMLGVRVSIEPLDRIDDTDWKWYVGLDAEATRIGNALWKGEPVSEDEHHNVLALYSLHFEDQTAVLPHLDCAPVYLILAVDRNQSLRMKPQNLLEGLPLAAAVQHAGAE
jgi:hypothetical protein